MFVYEHRSSDAPPAPWFPSKDVKTRWQRISEIAQRPADPGGRSGSADAPRSRSDVPFTIAYAWAAGEGFAEVVEDEELTGGDFVRTTKQLIDLLRQMAIVAPVAERARAADAAAERLFPRCRRRRRAPFPVPTGTDYR